MQYERARGSGGWDISVFGDAGARCDALADRQPVQPKTPSAGLS